MSVFFDCLWWWRGTFNNKANPYTEEAVGALSSAELPNNNNNGSPAALQMIAGGGESQDPAAHGAMFDLSDIPDWDWDVLCNVDWDQQPGI
jgi:hypothetical protein